MAFTPKAVLLRSAPPCLREHDLRPYKSPYRPVSFPTPFTAKSPSPKSSENTSSRHTNYLANQPPSQAPLQPIHQPPNPSNPGPLQSTSPCPVNSRPAVRRRSSKTMALKTDTKPVMDPDLEDFYIETVGLFDPDTPVSQHAPAGGVVRDEFGPLFRDVRLFVQHLKLVASQHGPSVYWIIHTCFMGSAKRWYNQTLRKKKLENSKFNDFCQALLDRFDKEYEPQRQQQAKEARIAKEQAEAKARAEAFACRRCPAKYPSNTQLHKHIDEHHAKKPKDTKSEVPIPAQDHKTPSPPPPQAPLTISPPTVILNQAPTSPITAPITPPVTPVTSPQITWAAIAAKPAIKPPPTPPPSPPQTPVHLHAMPSKQSKPYMTIDDLFAMFAGKRFRKSVDTIRKKIPSPAPRQTNITSYFKPASSRKIKSFKSDLLKHEPKLLLCDE